MKKPTKKVWIGLSDEALEVRAKSQAMPEIELDFDAHGQRCWDNGVEWCRMHHPPEKQIAKRLWEEYYEWSCSEDSLPLTFPDWLDSREEK